MGRLVAAFGSSHSVMLVARREDWIENFRTSDRRMPLFDKAGAALTYDGLLAAAPPYAADMVTPDKIEEAHRQTQDAVAQLRRDIEASELDVLLILGDDQHELFQASLMPAIAIYSGETIRNAGLPAEQPADWYKQAQMRRREPEGDFHYPCHPKLAAHLIRGLTERDFDITTVGSIAPDQHEGHAYSYIHRTYLPGRKDMAVIPVFLNTYYPPNTPTPARCVRFGQELTALIQSYPEDIRVGIMASGGLSHFVVDEELDHAVIAAFRAKDLDYLAGLDPERLKAGSSEIRSWIVTAAAAAQALELSWISYIPAYRTPALTGIGLGFARWS